MNLETKTRYLQFFLATITFVISILAWTNFSEEKTDKALCWFCLSSVGFLGSVGLILLSKKSAKKNNEAREIERLRVLLHNVHMGNWKQLRQLMKIYRESKFEENRNLAKNVLDEVQLIAFKMSWDSGYEEDTYAYKFPKVDEEKIRKHIISIYTTNEYGEGGYSWGGHHSHMEDAITNSQTNLYLLMMHLSSMNSDFGTNYRIYEIEEALDYYKEKLREFKLID